MSQAEVMSRREMTSPVRPLVSSVLRVCTLMSVEGIQPGGCVCCVCCVCESAALSRPLAASSAWRPAMCSCASASSAA